MAEKTIDPISVLDLIWQSFIRKFGVNDVSIVITEHK